MDHLKESNISVARDNLKFFLYTSIFVSILVACYYFLDSSVIETYRSIFYALLPALIFLLIIILLWFFGSFVFNIIFGKAFLNLRHSVYFRSRARFFRRRYFSRQTSIPHILSSKLYKRTTDRLNSRFLISVQYFIIFVTAFLLSIGVVWQVYQGNNSIVDKHWNKSLIWSILQLQFSAISIGLITIVFVLNFLDRNVRPLEHGSVLLRDLLLVRLIISVTILSLLLLVFIFVSDDLPSRALSISILFSFTLFFIVVISVFLIVERVIAIFLKAPEKVHLSSFKAKVVELSLIGRQKKNSAEILESVCSRENNRTDPDEEIEHQITLGDIGGKPGHYVADIHKKRLDDILITGEGNRIYAQFEYSVGDRVSGKLEPILSILGETKENEVDRVREELGTAIKFQSFDDRYNQDPWEQEYGIVDYMISEVEKNMKDSIENSDISMLNYNMHLYREMVWSCAQNSTFQSINTMPKNPADSTFRSIEKIFEYCINSSDIPTEVKEQMIFEIVRSIYVMSNDIRDTFGGRYEYERGVELLGTFESKLKSDDRDLSEEMRLLLRELE